MAATLGAAGARLSLPPGRSGARPGRPACAAAPAGAPARRHALAASSRLAGRPCRATLGPGGSQFFSDEDPNAPITRVIKDTSDKPDLLDDRTTPIWTVDWQEQMDAKAEKEKKAKESAKNGGGEPGGAGFLSFNRVEQLNDTDLDVGQLISKTPEERAQAEVAVVSSSPGDDDVPQAPRASLLSSSVTYTPDTPATNAWSRVRTKVVVDEVAKKQMAPEQIAAVEAREVARYDQLCGELYMVTGGSVAIGVVSGVATSGLETGASFLLGGLGALFYVRLLIQQVNGLTGQGGGMGPPRLVIPVILAMAFNRYNTLLAPDTGFELSFFPIVLGFLTYKIATTFQVFRSLQLASQEEDYVIEDGGTMDTMMRELEKT